MIPQKGLTVTANYTDRFLWGMNGNAAGMAEDGMKNEMYRSVFNAKNAFLR